MSYIHNAVAVVLEELPGLQPGQADLYALLVLTKGAAATLSDVHDVWAIWCPDADHPCMTPFAYLPPEAQEQDQPFLDGVHRAARRLAHAARLQGGTTDAQP